MPLYFDLCFITDAYILASACSCYVCGQRWVMYALTLSSYHQSIECYCIPHGVWDSTINWSFLVLSVLVLDFLVSLLIRINDWLVNAECIGNTSAIFVLSLYGSPHFFKIKELTWHADNRIEGINKLDRMHMLLCGMRISWKPHELQRLFFAGLHAFISANLKFYPVAFRGKPWYWHWWFKEEYTLYWRLHRRKSDS